MQSGLAGWPTPLLYCFRGDYAPSIGHAPRPLHLMYRERKEESDGEGGEREAGREGGMVEGGGASSPLSHLRVLVKLCSSRAHMSASL